MPATDAAAARRDRRNDGTAIPVSRGTTAARLARRTAAAIRAGRREHHRRPRARRVRNMRGGVLLDAEEDQPPGLDPTSAT